MVVLDTARDAHNGDEHRRRACGVHVQLECAPGDERLLDLEDAQLYLDLPCDRRGAAAITDHATGGYKAPVDAAAAPKAQLHVIPSKRRGTKYGDQCTGNHGMCDKCERWGVPSGVCHLGCEVWGVTSGKNGAV